MVASLGSLPLIKLASSSEVIKLLGLWLSLQDKQAELEDREEWEGESCRLWAYQTHPSRKRGVSEVLCVAERDAVMCVFTGWQSPPLVPLIFLTCCHHSSLDVCSNCSLHQISHIFQLTEGRQAKKKKEERSRKEKKSTEWRFNTS